MFSLFRKQTRRINEEFSSALYDEVSFYGSFLDDLKNAQKSVIIESPYLTERRASEFCRLFSKLSKRGVSIRINTRDPKHHDNFLKIQAWKAIKILKKNGVRVFICSDMRHRKLAIVDDAVLWEGSLNILSQSNSKEIMRRTVSKTMCEQMAKFTKINNRYW